MSRLRVNIRVLQMQHSNINSGREAHAGCVSEEMNGGRSSATPSSRMGLAGAYHSSCLRLLLPKQPGE